MEYSTLATTQIHPETQIRRATTVADLEACQRLRYAVFVQEQNHTVPGARNWREHVVDPLDADAIVMGAFRAGRALATCRFNAHGNERSPYRDLYDLDVHEARLPGGIAVLSKLAIARPSRGSRLYLAFLRSVFSEMLEAGVRLSFVGSRRELVGMYAKLGYQTIGSPVEVEGFGEIFPMCLDNQDLDHLTRTRSPLKPVLEEYLQNQRHTFVA